MLLGPFDGELLRRSVGERAVWTLIFVLDPLGFDDAACVGRADEPVLVQTFVTEFPAEAFDVRVLVRLAGADERQLHAAAIGPLVEHMAVEFRPVIDGARLWQATRIGKSVENSLHPQSCNPVIP